MLISHDHKFVFVHIYKTAGSSIEHTLQPFAEQAPRILKKLQAVAIRFQIPLPDIIKRVMPYPKHINAGKLRAALPPGMFDEYFSFAFVRNPWDLQVSLYHYILKDPWLHQHKEVSELGSFDAYIEWRLQQGQPQQRSFVVDENGDQIVDFIGKLENLEQDFMEICQRIGVQVKLDHINKSIHKPYREYYSDATRDAIAALCKEDIEAFGYTF